MTESQEITDTTQHENDHGGQIQDPAAQIHRLRVELPGEPPQLNRPAAKALLKLLLKARHPRVTTNRSEET